MIILEVRVRGKDNGEEIIHISDCDIEQLAEQKAEARGLLHKEGRIFSSYDTDIRSLRVEP